MFPTHEPAKNERGIALVIAMLVLVLLTAAALSMMATTTAQSKQSSVEGQSERSLALAEAGVAEAVSRLGKGEIAETGNPRQVTQIFNTRPETVPMLGADSTALATGQPNGEWLAYSTPGRSSEALTVRYKTNAARTAILRYDPAHTPCVSTVSGNPIFEVVATGAAGNARSRVLAELVERPIDVSNIRAAVSGTSEMTFEGRGRGHVVVNGMNHMADTPALAGITGTDPEHYTSAGDRPAVWCTREAEFGRGALAIGSDTNPVRQNQPGMLYFGPWEALSMTQAEFATLAGPAINHMPGEPSGVTFLDNNTTAQDRSGSWVMDNCRGEGLLYVDGDLTINGDFQWRGLIYVEGNLRINGSAWVLGATVIHGEEQFTAGSGNATFLYSSSAIQQYVGRPGGQFTRLAWRQID